MFVDSSIGTDLQAEALAGGDLLLQGRGAELDALRPVSSVHPPAAETQDLAAQTLRVLLS